MKKGKLIKMIRKENNIINDKVLPESISQVSL